MTIEEHRPEWGFPMPNDKIGERTVIASTYYTDDIVTVLFLNPTVPFFTVAQVDLRNGDLADWGSRHENIVPAVREYEQNGGDY